MNRLKYQVSALSQSKAPTPRADTLGVIWYFILDLEGLEKSGKKWEDVGYDGMDLVFLNVVVVRHWAVGNWIADKKIFEKKSLIVWWGFLYFILD